MTREAHGPECEACGSTKLVLINAKTRWGKPWARFRCDDCGTIRQMGMNPEPANCALEYSPLRTRCPECDSATTNVISTRRPFSRDWPMTWTKRYHKCLACAYSFASYEQHSKAELARYRKRYNA